MRKQETSKFDGSAKNFEIIMSNWSNKKYITAQIVSYNEKDMGRYIQHVQYIRLNCEKFKALLFENKEYLLSRRLIAKIVGIRFVTGLNIKIHLYTGDNFPLIFGVNENKLIWMNSENAFWKDIFQFNEKAKL